MSKKTSIPLSVDIDRVIEVLAAQIYQSPLALLRENLQNAYDATLLRTALEGDTYSPRIDVSLSTSRIEISDNGIGMSQEDIENHFWRAGSSSKNTKEAREAGVVGTFGIGAMANFGIAQTISVESERVGIPERTISTAVREKLSATEDCIDIDTVEAKESPGTTVIATLFPQKPLDLNAANTYIKQCVHFLPIPVYVDGTVVSQEDPSAKVPAFVDPAWELKTESGFGGALSGTIEIQGNSNGEIRVQVSNLVLGDATVRGNIVFRSGIGAIETYRSGFNLATTAVSSIYQFGGVADAAFLIPTAGREALESASQQLMQSIATTLDQIVSIEFSKHEQCDRSTQFLQWAINNSRLDLCDLVTIRVEPGDPYRLERFKGRPCTLYSGQDANIIDLYSSDESRLAVLATTNPRRTCQHQYLNRFSQIDPVDDTPKLRGEKDSSDYSFAESSFIFRVISILETDYFINAQVGMSILSHPIPVLVDQSRTPTFIHINVEGSAVQSLLQLYGAEYEVFGHMIKDFVRTSVFPKIATLVPSATREGAEAFLRRMRTRRELFEYEREDLSNLSEIWKDVAAGKITVDEGARRSQQVARSSFQVVGAPQSANEVVPDLAHIEQGQLEAGVPMPAISRTDIETDAKLLYIPPEEPAVNGYRSFISLTDKVFEDRGDFFLQPHSTDIVWGGQRVLFVFEHHSGEFGLYYDIQTPGLVSSMSGGGSQLTSTLFMQNRIFVPIPTHIQGSFMPESDERITLEVRCEILYSKRKGPDPASLRT